MTQYFLYNGAENIGPFDKNDLKVREITKDTPLWCEGMENWKNAGEIEELAGILASMPPPISTNYENPDELTDEEKKTHWFWKGLRIAAVVSVICLGLFAFGSYVSDSKTVSASTEKTSESVDKEKSNPEDFLVAKGNYHKNFFGGKYLIEGSIKNNASTTSYKNPVIEVTFFDKNKSELRKEKFTLYNTYKPGSKRSFDSKVKNYDNVESISWKVSTAEVK
jgi:hypothetical protein